MTQEEYPSAATEAATGRAGRMRTRIAATFAPALLELEDESARHAGHAGVEGLGSAGGETHFALLVVSDAFDGLSRVQRSRAVHEALADEFRSGLHALSLTLRTPTEQHVQRPPGVPDRGASDPR